MLIFSGEFFVQTKKITKTSGHLERFAIPAGACGLGFDRVDNEPANALAHFARLIDKDRDVRRHIGLKYEKCF